MRRLISALAAGAVIGVGALAPAGAASAAPSGPPEKARATIGTVPAAAATTPTLLPAPKPGLQVAVTSVSPQVATPTTDVTLTLTVANRGSVPLTGLAASVAIGDLRFTKRGQIGRWLRSAATAGPVLAEVRGTASAEPLAPGTSRTMTVVVPHRTWRLGRSFAALPVVVTVAPTGADATVPAATARTVLPWVSSTPEYLPLQVAWAVPLTAPADPHLFNGTGPELLTAWTQAIGPDSAVRRRLAAAGGAPVTWFVDPTIVEGPRYVAGASGRPTQAAAPTSPPAGPAPAPDTTQARVQQATALTNSLVSALSTVPATQTVWALPPGDPDTAQLVDHAPSESLTKTLFPDGATPLDTALHQTVPRATAWPADGIWTQARDDGWSDATGGYPMTAALVSSSSLLSSVGYTPAATHRSPDGTALLTYDEELSDIAGGTAAGASTESPSEIVQRFLGESLVLLGEREGTARGTVVAVPRTARVSPGTISALLKATAAAPWMRTTTLPALTAGLPTAPVARLRKPPAALEPASPVTGDTAARVEDELARAAGIGQLLAHAQAGLVSTWSGAAAQLLSARWRADPARWSALDHSVTQTITGTAGGIQLKASNLNFLADAGKVAVTVMNTLPYPVSGVRLTLTPGNGKLRVDQQPEPFSINAKSRRTVNVDVSALGSGEVPVAARLATPNGTELGTAATVTLNVWPPGEWLIYVMGGFFALVLVAGLLRTLSRKPTRAVRDDIA